MRNAQQQRKAILEALEELVPAEKYATTLAELLDSKDQRVKARGLELLAKLQGTIADSGGDGMRVVVAFGSVLTGQAVAKHQGLSGVQDDATPDLPGAD